MAATIFPGAATFLVLVCFLFLVFIVKEMVMKLPSTQKNNQIKEHFKKKNEKESGKYKIICLLLLSLIKQGPQWRHCPRRETQT